MDRTTPNPLDALTPGSRPLADYYADHPCQDDGGCLSALVEDFAAVQPVQRLWRTAYAQRGLAA